MSSFGEVNNADDYEDIENSMDAQFKLPISNHVLQ